MALTASLAALAFAAWISTDARRLISTSGQGLPVPESSAIDAEGIFASAPAVAEGLPDSSMIERAPTERPTLAERPASSRPAAAGPDIFADPLSDAFETEPRDTAWARPIELTLFSSLYALEFMRGANIEPHCRTSVCKVSIVYPPMPVRELHAHMNALGKASNANDLIEQTGLTVASFVTGTGQGYGLHEIYYRRNGD